MKTTRQYLADVKRALGISSDYALAKALGISKQGAASLTGGRTIMNNTTAARVAEILELEAIQVIADAELERGSSPELWTRIRAAAAVLVGAVAGALLFHALSSSFDITIFREAFVTLAVVVSDAGRNTHCMLFAAAIVAAAVVALWPLRARRPIMARP